MGHTFSNVLVHIIFSTKGRMNLLYKDMQDELYRYICGIVKGEGGQIIKIGGVEDHIHILASVKTSLSISDLVRKIKAGSSSWIHGKFINLKEFSWQSGYAVFSVSESAKKAVGDYIATQKEHHHRLSFEDELKLFLQKNGIDFDAEHYLD